MTFLQILLVGWTWWHDIRLYIIYYGCNFLISNIQRYHQCFLHDFSIMLTSLLQILSIWCMIYNLPRFCSLDAMEILGSSENHAMKLKSSCWSSITPVLYPGHLIYFTDYLYHYYNTIFFIRGFLKEAISLHMYWNLAFVNFVK